ncbi:MAG: PEP-CTERM sorting domain-containing protein [Chthoniobacterales bacterium]
MKILPPLAAGLLLASAALTQAALTVYEPFDYPDFTFTDGTPVTGAGLTGTATVRDSFDLTGSSFVNFDLFYPDLPTTGESVSTPGGTNTRILETLATPLSSGTVWISVLVQNGGNSGAVPVGFLLNGDQPSSVFAGFVNGVSTTDTAFGLGTKPSGTAASITTFTTAGPSVAISNTAVHLIVLSIAFNTSGNFDTINLYIDPIVGQSLGAPNSTVTTLDVGTITGVGQDRAGGVGFSTDEIRIGDSYADVVPFAVPEPRVFALLGAGALIMVTFRRRSHRA